MVPVVPKIPTCLLLLIFIHQHPPSDGLRPTPDEPFSHCGKSRCWIVRNAFADAVLQAQDYKLASLIEKRLHSLLCKTIHDFERTRTTWGERALSPK